MDNRLNKLRELVAERLPQHFKKFGFNFQKFSNYITYKQEGDFLWFDYASAEKSHMHLQNSLTGLLKQMAKAVGFEGAELDVPENRTRIKSK